MPTIYTINHDKNPNVFIHAMQGHFVSSHAHINYYVGTSDCKHNHTVSTQAAELLAETYRQAGVDVDTVLCLYETQVLGAYLAHELSKSSMLNPDPDYEVYVLGPEQDAAGNIIFRDNLRRMINGKNIVILMSCVDTGETCRKAIESINYYGGNILGISAIFSVVDNVDGIQVNSLFTKNDTPGYASYSSHDCPLCKAGEGVDAISNGYGYSTL